MEERAVDETGQAGSPEAGGAYPGGNLGPDQGLGRGRSAYPNGQVNGGTPSDDALEAIVSAWREPATGAIAGRAQVTGAFNINGINGLNGSGLNGANGNPSNGVNGTNGANGGTRGRAEVRGPYSDMLAPMSPPVSPPPPPVQPPAPQAPMSTLHYGHYGPDGQGWPTSSPTGETKSVPPPAPGTVYGALSAPLDHTGELRRPISAQPSYEPPPAPAYEPTYDRNQSYEAQPYEAQPYEAYEQAHTYEQPASALERVAEHQQAPDAWGYTGGSYQPQEQRHWAPEPSQPEFDWAAPVQHPTPREPVSAPPPAPVQPQSLPSQRVPENDPLAGPLPPLLLGSATSMTAPEPVMPTFADDMTQPAYDAPELPQRVPSEPDVPPIPAGEPQASAVGAPELTRITDYLREEQEGQTGDPDNRPDGFDVQSVLRAVQTVGGVHRATLRKNADGLHTLRLELADEADAGQVSRIVARMLNETMGLSAEQNPLLPDGMPEPAAPYASTPASAPVPTPRPPVNAAAALNAARNSPHSALPGYGRESRRRRPVSSGARKPAPLDQKAPALTPNPGSIVSPRVVIESVDVNTQGIDATVEVRLTADNQPAIGVASGPNFDGYMLKLAALAAASAVDQLLIDTDATVRARCYIEHAAVVALGGCEVAVVVLLLMYDGFVEQLTGSAVVAADGDSRQAVVRATMAAVNRRLEALLP
ncbi:hypothetical protein GCM10018962_17950 [Dactylosporangium matsuzakiense]|uniref:Uncharacterized protein n=1 Tax=Dactylosporangium matsuzakiense TaxID=53360 RepID=A0A9W6KC86_9ACTN|nr:hypothetical protein GCM10017581_011870 [Dactylosporangium matsuzakiense]